MLQAHSGALADIGASVQEHSRRLTWQLLGIDEASPLLQGALDGWAALEDVLMSTSSPRWRPWPDTTPQPGRS